MGNWFSSISSSAFLSSFPNVPRFCFFSLFHVTLSTMLPTTSPNSNGALGSADNARHTAGFKRYKYLRRLLHLGQMDFDFAVWQMLYLFTSPQRVYRNFHYRKQTKDQWARDDPAFLVLLGIWLCGECAIGKMLEPDVVTVLW